MTSLDHLREDVLQRSLFPPCPLGEAMEKVGFVQADPIRSPARSQDLILRHRVNEYAVGELERSYPVLDVEEGYLYAYGFLSKELWRMLHPKTGAPLTDAEQKALTLLAQYGSMQPKDLEARVGGERTRNYWGGFSRAAKLTLESLQDRGVVRVVRREKGNRVYALAEALEQPLSKQERFQNILMAAAKSMGPTTPTVLLRDLSHFNYLVEGADARRECLQRLIKAGRMRTERVDSVEYVSLEGENGRSSPLDRVRILAPFDPIVRDRARFEHLWGWSYRFEAYTPKAKRQRGYYAMPVLWRERIPGWANAAVANGRLLVRFGYVSARPQEHGYREAAEAEVARLARFLGLGDNSWEAAL